jgi:hypothetical protein
VASQAEQDRLMLVAVEGQQNICSKLANHSTLFIFSGGCTFQHRALFGRNDCTLLLFSNPSILSPNS